ncbi:MAG: IS1595 family transposase [Parcubacteria group bacterium]
MERYPVVGIRSSTEDWHSCIKVFLRERTLTGVVRETSMGMNRAQRMLHHLRVVMSADIPDRFAGPVELDETYIGGQRKNKRLYIRRIQAKKGHGTDKLPIVGLFDRSSGQIIVVVEPSKLNMPFILNLVGGQVEKGARIYTDGFKMYRMLKGAGYAHHFVDHDGGELVRGDVHTNNIEGFWGILKRKLSCIGGIRRARLPLFVSELVWRFNHRKDSLEEQAYLLYDLFLKE